MRPPRFVRSLGDSIRRTLARLVTWFFERRYGLQTTNDVELEELGLAHPERGGYIPAGWLTLRRILRRGEVSRDDVFLDLGSGKGRAVLLAAHHPFKRVIGVEISRELNAIAEANVRRNIHRLRCKDIELVNQDVLDYHVPEDVTVVFLFNPFKGEIFAAAIERILRSIDAHPRAIRLIYVNPLEEQSLLATGRATLVGTGPPRAGPEFRVYVLR